jgi:signal transduction histidine kinase
LKKVNFYPGKMFIAIKERALQKLRKEKKSFVDFILDIPESQKTVNLDYNRFYKIVFQLVDNSIKYTETGYIKLGYSIDDSTGNMEAYIIDTGIGIKKEKLEIVFESFRKVEKNRIKFHPGTGLGLSLVKGLVRIMDGQLIIDTLSEDELVEGKTSGTSIKVIIPNTLQ